MNEEAGREEARVTRVQQVSRVRGRGDEDPGAKGDDDYSVQETATQHQITHTRK